MKLNRILPVLALLTGVIVTFNGCNHSGNKSQAIIHHDTVYVTKIHTDTLVIRDTVIEKSQQISFILWPDMYDSAKTQEELYRFLWHKEIDSYTRDNSVELETRSDLKYLPYYILNCSDFSLGDKPAYELISFCTEAIDDKKLFDLGKKIIDKVNDQRYPAYMPIEYPDSFTKGGMETCREFMWFEPTAIDTIRVRAIAHNDRDALAKLEKYYHDNGNDKELAIYYKVMLSYEGNCDLAERFYRVLEPYFAETPELRIAVREVLLRAAYCDNDIRAQELCDSLGFSLCDYRLQIPE